MYICRQMDALKNTVEKKLKYEEVLNASVCRRQFPFLLFPCLTVAEWKKNGSDQVMRALAAWRPSCVGAQTSTNESSLPVCLRCISRAVFYFFTLHWKGVVGVWSWPGEIFPLHVWRKVVLENIFWICFHTEDFILFDNTPANTLMDPVNWW